MKTKEEMMQLIAFKVLAGFFQDLEEILDRAARAYDIRISYPGESGKDKLTAHQKLIFRELVKHDQGIDHYELAKLIDKKTPIVRAQLSMMERAGFCTHDKNGIWTIIGEVPDALFSPPEGVEIHIVLKCDDLKEERVVKHA